MGNTKSSTSRGILRYSYAASHEEGESPPPLTMMAVAQKIYVKKVHIMMLRYSMAKLSDKYGMIQRDGFEKALVRANLSDFQVFDMLFTLWDNAENGKVPYREFCIGISPLSCPFDDLTAILEFAIRVNDNPNRKHIEWKEVYELLSGINSMASYFGDAHLLPDEIDEIIESLFEEQERISHEDCIKHLSMNAYVLRFASGKSRSHVRFHEVLETKYIFDKNKFVSECVVDCIDTLTTTYKHTPSLLGTNGIRTIDSGHVPLLAKAHSSMSQKGMMDIPLADNDCVDENSAIVGNSMPSSSP